MTNAACRPDVIRQQAAIESFCLRPDGGAVTYVRRHVSGSGYRSHLWTVSIDGGLARQLTHGDLRDSSPVYSPDGSRVAFVRTPNGADHGRVWIVSADGGEPQALAELPHGVSALRWSPDGRWLALLAASADDVPYIIGPNEPDKAPRVRRITRLDWHDDDDGHRDRRTHLFLMRPEPGAQPRQLTRGDWDVHRPVWAPDSKSIAFATDQRDKRDIDPRASIWTVAVDSPDGPSEIAALPGDADFPAYSPDGSRLAFLGCDVPDAPEYEPYLPWLMPAAGGEPAVVDIAHDGLIGTWAWSDLDLIYGDPGPLWLDHETLVVLVSRRGRCVPVAVSLSDGGTTPLVTADRVMASAMEVGGGRIVVSATVDGRAAELYAVEEGALRRLTSDGSAWQDGCVLPLIEEVEIPGPAGPINTWILSPPDAGREPLPTIIHFHGGPTGSFGPGSSLDAILLTGAGYRVAMPNIRGSAGFGYDWAAALRGRWGDVDQEDAHAVTDWLIEQGLTDKNRIGIYGFSYGGYLAQWLVGHTDRFAAAVSEAGVANQVSTWANSYFGVHYNRRYDLGDPLSREGAERLWSSSPLAFVANITTPLLMIQGEDDKVCPASDNVQLFTALRALGREVEYILYPEEHHEFKVYGRPDRRIDRHERIMAWFKRHLG